MKHFFRKLFKRNTNKLQNEAHRENVQRECAKNYEAASQLIRSSRVTRKVTAPKLLKYEGPIG